LALLLDLRYAWRGIRKARGFTAIILLTLALGIGANATIFSIVHAMLIEPLPYRDADRLAFLWLGFSRGPLSGPDFRDIREGTRSFEELGGIWASGTVALGGDGDPEQLRTSFVTTNFFHVLGAESAFGRTFRDEDGRPGAPSTILLGWDLFTRRYGGDPSIVGRQIIVNDVPTTVIGVMPRAFRLLLPLDSGVPDHLQVWQPFWPEFETGPRGNQFMRVVGRMRPGVTMAQARADVDAVAGGIRGEMGTARAFTTVGLQADDTREFRGPLLSLFAGVGILLTIACVNVGGLLIARAASRGKETALRLALGASRARLLRQALVEGLLLAAQGAVAGIAAAHAGLKILLAHAPESLGRLTASDIDGTVFFYTAAISLIWGVLFSLAPVRYAARGPDRVECRAACGRRTAGPGVRRRSAHRHRIPRRPAFHLPARPAGEPLRVERSARRRRRTAARAACRGSGRDGRRCHQSYPVRRSAQLGTDVRDRRGTASCRGSRASCDHARRDDRAVRDARRPVAGRAILHGQRQPAAPGRDGR
jgi:putative ABC transport system permease protein